METLNKLNTVLKFVKESFIGKDEIVDLLGISLVAGENTFLLGPPGTAKSAIVRLLSQSIEDGKNFEYLLTRFTEPNEIFGPFDIRKLKEGELVTNTDGMLPEASLIFLDEIFNANSAILNSLLMALNEKIFRRGKETKKLPALIFIGASNVLPEEDSLNALLDRFLIRAKCDYVDPDSLQDLLIAGWNLENNQIIDRPTIASEEIQILQFHCRKVNLSNIRKDYIDIVHTLRNTGIKVSDRRAVKLQNLIAASALISGRNAAIKTDLWVLKYIWDTEDQIEILESIINNIIEKDIEEKSHPQALMNKAPDPEDVMKEVKFLAEKWQTESLSFEEQNAIKDKLRYVQNRCAWIKNIDQRTYIESEIESLWQKILKTI
ncbi:MAG: AAA domain-containing protein [Leptospira sp.]|jgi:MoxR-like ATPase|nr:AAA domain-containing protein [Leptospira sp.]NCS93271.1 AAA domain-containing protein [Leptospira sp.]